MAGAQRSYPTPERHLVIRCTTCNCGVAGETRGIGNYRALLKAMKGHEDEAHPPYDRDLIPQLTRAVEAINAGNGAPQQVSRYIVEPFRNQGLGPHRSP